MYLFSLSQFTNPWDSTSGAHADPVPQVRNPHYVKGSDGKQRGDHENEPRPPGPGREKNRHLTHTPWPSAMDKQHNRMYKICLMGPEGKALAV